jgi:hypothetical protein
VASAAEAHECWGSGGGSVKLVCEDSISGRCDSLHLVDFGLSFNNTEEDDLTQLNCLTTTGWPTVSANGETR